MSNVYRFTVSNSSMFCSSNKGKPWSSKCLHCQICVKAFSTISWIWSILWCCHYWTSFGLTLPSSYRLFVKKSQDRSRVHCGGKNKNRKRYGSTCFRSLFQTIFLFHKSVFKICHLFIFCFISEYIWTRMTSTFTGFQDSFKPFTERFRSKQ